MIVSRFYEDLSVFYHKNTCFKKVYHFVHITAYYVYRQKFAQIYKISIAVKDKTK